MKYFDELFDKYSFKHFLLIIVMDICHKNDQNYK